MVYSVYENWLAEKKAVILIGDCSFCNDGKGLQATIHGNQNRQWHGPFDTYNEVSNFANSLYDRTVKDCSFCISSITILE